MSKFLERLNIKEKFKEFIRFIKRVYTADIPPLLNRRFIGEIMAGGFITFIGISLGAVMRSLSVCVFLATAGILLIILGFNYKRIILSGYAELTGTIIRHTAFPVPFRKRVRTDAYIVQMDDPNHTQLYIPTKDAKEHLPIGFVLRVYVAINRSHLDENGDPTYGNVLGYELLSSEEDV